MKSSDFIVEFLIRKGISDVFGYPGGMITHFMDSLYKRAEIRSHLTYNEQGAAFAACGYAQVSGKLGVAYTTSGPGATNLITGIANAYYDSIPTLFITGQVNVYEQKKGLPIKQKGFQEMPIVDIVKPITKYCYSIKDESELVGQLNKAYDIAMSGRKGPVLLDIPMNIQRMDIDSKYIISESTCKASQGNIDIILRELSSAKRPLIIAGNGVNLAQCRKSFREFVEKVKAPVVTSMIAVDLLETDNKYNFGFIGAYGNRTANFLVAKADLIISVGSRLDCRQTGNDKTKFAVGAKIVRIDIDVNEFTNIIKPNEIQLVDSLESLIPALNAANILEDFGEWLDVCVSIKEKLRGMDMTDIGHCLTRLSAIANDDAIITTDVGQNQVWAAQSFMIKRKQRMLFSGGHGSMGYSLPAAIGAFFGGHRQVIALNGDGGIQMNIQELQVVARERLPLKIIIFNNHSLGMIRHFQELYFDSNYAYTKECGGYVAPNFVSIAHAYGIRSVETDINVDFVKYVDILSDDKPLLMVINSCDNTYILPKSTMGHEVYNQEPFMDKALVDDIMKM